MINSAKSGTALLMCTAAPGVSLSLNPGYSTVAALAAGEWESQNGISAIGL
jgi:hypothetical protein